MAQHQDVGRIGLQGGQDRRKAHRRDVGIDQADLVARVDQRSADLQQAQGGRSSPGTRLPMDRCGGLTSAIRIKRSRTGAARRSFARP